jgi:hypothetical protein
MHPRAALQLDECSCGLAWLKECGVCCGNELGLESNQATGRPPITCSSTISTVGFLAVEVAVAVATVVTADAVWPAGMGMMICGGAGVERQTGLSAGAAARAGNATERV